MTVKSIYMLGSDGGSGKSEGGYQTLRDIHEQFFCLFIVLFYYKKYYRIIEYVSWFMIYLWNKRTMPTSLYCLIVIAILCCYLLLIVSGSVSIISILSVLLWHKTQYNVVQSTEYRKLFVSSLRKFIYHWPLVMHALVYFILYTTFSFFIPQKRVHRPFHTVEKWKSYN